MTDETVLSVRDPHDVKVIFCNQVVGSGALNGVVNITMAVANFMPVGGKVIPDIVVAARLRFDLYAAQQLRDELDKILAQNVKPSSTVQ